MSFNENTLLEALSRARPGEQLDFTDIPNHRMMSAIKNMTYSNTAPEGARDIFGDLDLGSHVSQVSYWWGVEIQVDHEAMQALQKVGAAAALAAVGINPFIAGIVAGVIGIWSAFDVGNGVNFYVTWIGVHWFTPR